MAAMGDPRRMNMLSYLTTEAASATQLARMMDESPQTMQYHLKVLEKAGLVEIVDTRQARGAVEKFYRAVADQFTFDEKIGESPGAGGLGLDFITEWVKLGRIEAEVSDEPSVYHATVLAMDCNPEDAKKFAAGTLSHAGEEYRALDRDGGDSFVLVTALFRIPKDKPLPEAPKSPFVNVHKGTVAIDVD